MLLVKVNLNILIQLFLNHMRRNHISLAVEIFKLINVSFTDIRSWLIIIIANIIIRFYISLQFYKFLDLFYFSNF